MFNFIFNKRSVFTIIILFVFTCSFSQNPSPPKDITTSDLIHYAKEKYGLDDRLINGKVYQPIHHLAKGHPYFLNANLKKGTLYIKGTTYKDLDINYNIETDEIILRTQFKNGLITYILLNSSFIDSLSIENHFFINSSVITSSNPIGFLERLYKGKYSAYLKHNKSFVDTQSLEIQFGEYIDSKEIIYITDGKTFTKINSKNAIINYFPTHKKEIKKYMRGKSILFNSITSNQLYNLFSYCDKLSTTSTKKK